jgi:hypothetical protein
MWCSFLVVGLIVALIFFLVKVWVYLNSNNHSRPTPTKTKKPNDETTNPSFWTTTPKSDEDAWEGAFYDVVAQRSAKKRVRLQYTDGKGATSQRVIDIRAYEPLGPSGLVIAHCHHRNATRTFRFDRMENVVDMETGELISDLQQKLNEEWQASPEPVLDQLYRDHNEVLKLMLFMAKADGAVRVAELEIIAKYCQEITGDSRITVELTKDFLQFVDVVNTGTFTRLYNKLRREKPEAAQKAADACRAIVATQKTIHPNEQAALQVLDKLPKSLKS